MRITRAELAAAIEESHKRSLKLAGHLCSVGYGEAMDMGIDSLEHGPVFSDSEFDPNKKPDVCPSQVSWFSGWANTAIASPPVQDLIRDLVSYHVVITSTLPVFEQLVPGRPPLQERVLDAMASESRLSYLAQRAGGGSPALGLTVPWEQLLKKEMEFERAFVKGGGLLLAGPHPTGIGGVLPGFDDQRELELLVEAGFTPLEAIQIATHNGAQYLGQLDRIGTIVPGKHADLVVIKGDPSKKIEDIENVGMVFKDGVVHSTLRNSLSQCAVRWASGRACGSPKSKRLMHHLRDLDRQTGRSSTVFHSVLNSVSRRCGPGIHLGGCARITVLGNNPLD